MKLSLKNKSNKLGVIFKHQSLPETHYGFDSSDRSCFVMEPARRSSLQSKSPQKKTTFFLTSQEKGEKQPSNELKQAGEQDKGKTKFASVARTVLLANRAFPPATRKASRGNSLIPNQSEVLPGKFASSTTTASSVDDISSVYAMDKLTIENTYKLQPDEFFLTGKARAIIRDVLEAHLTAKSYIAEESKRLSVEISDEIKRKVKAEAPVERYKLVCVVWIGQQLGQGVHISSRCLWNANFDNFAQETFRNDQLFAQASVYAVFVE